MNTYFVILQKNAEVPPQEFYCDAKSPGHAIAAALNQIGPCDSVVASCHLYCSDTQTRINDFEVLQARARPYECFRYTEYLDRLRLPLPLKR